MTVRLNNLQKKAAKKARPVKLKDPSLLRPWNDKKQQYPDPLLKRDSVDNISSLGPQKIAQKPNFIYNLFTFGKSLLDSKPIIKIQIPSILHQKDR
jgi:hypothetical protein